MALTRTARILLLALIVLVTSLVGFGLFVPSARAVVGRPLTPMSYAGVARRTTRRSVAVGAAGSPYW